MKNYLILLLSLFGFLVQGQDRVILEKSVEIIIANKSKGLSIRENHRKSTEVLTQNSFGVSDVLHNSSLDKLVSKEAWTEYKTEKGKSKKLFVHNWETSSVDRRGVFFSGAEKVSFDFPKSEKGSICHLKYEKEIFSPQFLSSINIVENEDIKEFNLKIIYPKDTEIELDFRNADSLIIIRKIDTLESNLIQYVTINNIPEYNFIDKIESSMYYMPYLLIRVKSYINRGEKIKVSESPKDLYNWYSSLVKRIPEPESKDYKNEMELEAREIIQGLSSKEDRIEQIFKWVQKNVKYIAFEDGMNGFIPRNAYNIFHNRYGDCKDMANLTKTMLESVGIEAYLTWIGTRERPYTYTDVPSVITDNHMICSVKIKDDIVFLDATNENVQFRVSPSFIQGKQALIGLTDTTFTLEKVPVTSKDFSVRKDSLEMHFFDNELLSSFSTNLSGYFKEDFVQIEQLGKFHRDESFYLDYFNVGSKGYHTSDPKIEKNEDDLRINLLAKFQNKSIVAGSKLYLSLNMNDLYDNLKVDDLENRKVDIHEDHKYIHNIHTEFVIPHGYRLLSKLIDIKFDHKLFSYSQKLTEIDGEILIDQELIIDFIEMKKEDFKDYNTFLNTIKKTEQQKLKFEKL